MRFPHLFTVLLTSVVASAQAAGEEASIKFLSLKDGGAAQTDLSVEPNSDLQVPFTWSIPEKSPKAFDFYVTPFRGHGQGDYIDSGLSVAEQPDLKPKEQRLTVTLDRPILTLRLRVPDLPTGTKYEGLLVALHNGKVLRSAPLALARAKPERSVKLVIDRPAVRITEPIWPPQVADRPSFSVLVRNDSDVWAADRVFLRIKEVTGPEEADLDPIENLLLTWNGEEAQDLWRSPGLGESVEGSNRTIPLGRQATITGRPYGLAPGKYTVKLAVAASNAKPDEHPEATVTIRVRHSVFSALGVLLVAIGLSFVATKGLETERKRVALLRKISEIRPPWLREMPSILPVVAVRAMLKQAEVRNKGWFDALFAPDVVGGRVEKAAQLLGLIRRVRQIRQRIEKWNQDVMIRNRAKKRLGVIVQDLDPATIDEKQATQMHAKLDQLQSWLISDTLHQLYWEDLEADVEILVGQLSPEEFTPGNEREIVNELTKKIETQIKQLSEQPSATQPTGTQPQNRLSDYIEIERYYAKLKILWERRAQNDNEALKALVPLLKNDLDTPIDQFFQEADDIMWRRLKSACEEKGGIEFISPRVRSIQPLQAYELIRFEVAPANPMLANNYLFKHGLKYHWKLDIQRKRKWWQSGKEDQPAEPLTEDDSEEPRIIQYVPMQGKLHVTVELRRGNDRAEPVSMSDTLPIGASSDFGWAGAFRFVEVVALVLATVFAVVSGLGTFYFDEPVFGSAADYIALFMWGAGVDQAKNFVQNLAVVSPRAE